MNKVEVNNGWYVFVADYLDSSAANDTFTYFIENLPWKTGEIKLFGKVHPIPRKQVYFSDDNLSYSYSGKKLEIDEWNKKVLELKVGLSSSLHVEFNACLANLYRDGQDSNGWHSDNEKELGINPVIASLSFGTTRRFDLKHKLTNQKLSFQLTSGSLLVMGGEMQQFWKHQVPKEKKVQDPRVNLTFRKIIV